MMHRRRLLLGFLALLAGSIVARADQKVLYEKQSPFTTILVTEDDRGLRTLWFEKGGARQSVVKVGDPNHVELAYARVMPLGVAFVEAPKRILIVGLGGGTVPSFLHRHYPKAVIDAVDIDPDVVDVARRFFGFHEDANLRAHVADGRKFIEECKNPYDIIFLDAFGPDNIPFALATREFLLAVRRALTPKGIVVGDVWSSASNPLYDSMVRTYRDVFDELYIFDVRYSGNKILVALPYRKQIDRDDLAQRARQISQNKGFPFDMGEFVIYGYRDAKNEELRGQVLRDKE